MEYTTEGLIKVGMVAVLFLAGFLYWLVPRTSLAHRFHMSESLFVLTNIIGILCGIAGFLVTLVWPRLIIEVHLWELIILPFALIHGYWAVTMRVKSSSETYDEKQEHDMARAASLTWALSIPAMVILFLVDQGGHLGRLMWFPYYLFLTLAFYSGATLFNFKRR